MPLLSPLQVVQLSDTHLFADPNRELLGLSTADSLKTVLDSVRQIQPKPDLLLLTGDLSQDESAKSYERLRDLLEPLQIPAYWLPGNHDYPPLMAQILVTPFIATDKVFQGGGWNFILLNSMATGKVYGELSAASLDWLEQQLQQCPVQPTLIALHHPPCPIGSNWMDQIGLRHPEALFAVLDRYEQVKLVLFGHIHQEFTATRAGVQYLGCPSTCVQFKPQETNFAIDDQRPGFRLLSLYPGGEFTTTVKRVNYQPLPDLAATGY
ncbi:MAG: 3',5'-cyclic-AMP phosphodiesterase [Elainella sp. C42_A2020_010]|nr:3',5'-cyclic-AMP phosphodiesterase [Elainella sp. C42_A2020_010]